eukprot:261910_1
MNFMSMCSVFRTTRINVVGRIVIIFFICSWCILYLQFNGITQLNRLKAIELHNESHPFTKEPSHHQWITSEYITNLSLHNYDAFNEELIIKAQDDASYVFPKFSHQLLYDVFTNQSILLLGDSIMDYFCRFIAAQIYNYQLMRMHNNTLSDDALNHLKTQLTTFNHRLSISSGYHSYLLIFNVSSNNLQNAMEYFHKAYGWSKFQNIHRWTGYHFDQRNIMQNLARRLRTNDEMKINVIYSNKLKIDTLIHLESMFDTMVDAAVNNQYVKCIIFRPVNPICSNRYAHFRKFDYANATQFFNSIANISHEALIQNDIMKQCMDEYNITSGETVYVNYSYNHSGFEPYVIKGIDFCNTKYTLLNYGAMQVNDRMSKYVQNKQKAIEDSELKLFYADFFALYRNWCQYSDTIHFQHLEAVQLSVITNIVHNFCI